ncbi:hypothetical protein ACFL1L_04925, partial [Thermoplasmatota archaeon]
ILFGLLRSTGLFKNPTMEFGGPAAGYFAAMILLWGYYSSMDKRRFRNSELTKAFAYMYAQQIVNDSDSSIESLQQNYNLTVDHLRLYFKAQGVKWLDDMIQKLTESTKAAAWGIPALRSWTPRIIKINLVETNENI